MWAGTRTSASQGLRPTYFLEKGVMPSNTVINTGQEPFFGRRRVLPLEAPSDGYDRGRVGVGQDSGWDWCAGNGFRHRWQKFLLPSLAFHARSTCSKWTHTGWLLHNDPCPQDTPKCSRVLKVSNISQASSCFHAWPNQSRMESLSFFPPIFNLRTLCAAAEEKTQTWSRSEHLWVWLQPVHWFPPPHSLSKSCRAGPPNPSRIGLLLPWYLGRGQNQATFQRAGTHQQCYPQTFGNWTCQDAKNSSRALCNLFFLIWGSATRIANKASNEGLWDHNCMEAPFAKAGMAEAIITVVANMPLQVATLIGSKESWMLRDCVQTRNCLGRLPKLPGANHQRPFLL